MIFFTIRKSGRPTHFFDEKEENIACAVYESREMSRRKRKGARRGDGYTLTRQTTDEKGEIVRMAMYELKKHKWCEDMIIGGGIHG